MDLIFPEEGFEKSLLAVFPNRSRTLYRSHSKHAAYTLALLKQMLFCMQMKDRTNEPLTAAKRLYNRTLSRACPENGCGVCGLRRVNRAEFDGVKTAKNCMLDYIRYYVGRGNVAKVEDAVKMLESVVQYPRRNRAQRRRRRY